MKLKKNDNILTSIKKLLAISSSAIIINNNICGARYWLSHGGFPVLENGDAYKLKNDSIIYEKMPSKQVHSLAAEKYYNIPAQIQWNDLKNNEFDKEIVMEISRSLKKNQYKDINEINDILINKVNELYQEYQNKSEYINNNDDKISNNLYIDQKEYRLSKKFMDQYLGLCRLIGKIENKQKIITDFLDLYIATDTRLVFGRGLTLSSRDITNFCNINNIDFIVRGHQDNYGNFMLFANGSANGSATENNLTTYVANDKEINVYNEENLFNLASQHELITGNCIFMNNVHSSDDKYKYCNGPIGRIVLTKWNNENDKNKTVCKINECEINPTLTISTNTDLMRTLVHDSFGIIRFVDKNNITDFNDSIITIGEQKGGIYYNKYIKYKTKYLNSKYSKNNFYN